MSKTMRFALVFTAALSVVLFAVSPTLTAQTDPFALHSNAGAERIIYLDFAGHTTTGTWWNESYTNGAPITTPAYSNTAQILKIWERVAEDYAPFNVDVTTERPPADYLIKSNAADPNWGIHVAIGGSSSDWYKSAAGGIAYLYSFGLGSDTPAFVFTASLNNDVKNIAEAISHEVGHSLGLDHDGQGSTEYYRGTNGWAPIMGVGYYEGLTQWSNGEYANATNTQDDLSIITNPSRPYVDKNYGGVDHDFIPYKADDFGNALNDAESLYLINGMFARDGLIEQNTDVDMFKFTLDYDALLSADIFSGIYGDYSASTLATAGANLDILANLYYGTDNLLKTFDPQNTLGVSFTDLFLKAGDYFLSIEGTGKAGAYSDYGSLGTYLISGRYSYLPSATPEPATLLLIGLGLAGLGIARRRWKSI